MNTASRATLVAAALSHLLAACATAPLEPKNLGEMNFPDARLTILQVTVTGTAEPVLQSGNIGQLVLTRDGGSEAIGVNFENGALAVYELPPGAYNIAMIGPLACKGLRIETTTGTAPVALGSMTAKIIKNDNYYVALMSSTAASDTEIAGIAKDLKVASETIDSRVIEIPRSALCHQSHIDPGWQPSAFELLFLTLEGVATITAPLGGYPPGGISFP